MPENAHPIGEAAPPAVQPGRVQPNTDRAAGIRSRWLALAILCASAMMIILDGTIVTVALPSIQDDLGFSQPNLAWVVNAYLIAFAGLLLLFGRLGDLIGQKRVFVWGLGVFTFASLLCGVSGSQEMLVVARFVQGIGGAMASAVALGMIVTMFPEPRERASAIGVYGFVSAAGASVGTIAGGVLTQAASWHWVFIVNLPIGVAAVLVSLRLLPADRAPGMRGGADVAGAVFVTAGLMLAVYTIVGAADHGWVSARTGWFGAASVVLLIAFAGRQATARRPLVPPRLLRSRPLLGGNTVIVLLVAGMFGFQFLAALYLQRVMGLGALRTGLVFLPAPITIGAMSLFVSARLSARFGPRPVLLAGLALIVVGLALLARVPVHSRYAVDVLPVMLLLGLGFGTVIPVLMGLAMTVGSPADAGIASGLVNTTQQVGGALGLAVLATVATARSDSLRAAGHGEAAALTGGYHLAFAIGAGLVATAALVVATVLRTPKPQAGSSGATATAR